MFRRFMIVCWVALLVVVVLGGLSWNHSQNQLAALELLEKERRALSIAQTSADELRAIARRQGTTEATTAADSALIELARKRVRFGELEFEYGAFEELQADSEISLSISNVAIWIAFGLLLWNIIWHVGHWVWMGRKVDL